MKNLAGIGGDVEVSLGGRLTRVLHLEVLVVEEAAVAAEEIQEVELGPAMVKVMELGLV